MQMVSCPICGGSFPQSDGYCVRCKATELATAMTQPLGQEPDEPTQTLTLPRKKAMVGLEDEFLAEFDETLGEEDQDDELMERHETWQKLVEHKTPHALPAITRASLKRSRHLLLPAWGSPRTFFWLNLIILLAFLLGGGFGVAISFGRTIQHPAATQPALQVSPATVELGGIITLRGTHFTPGGTVELSRDKHLTLADTGGLSSIRADEHGLFSDTVIVDPAWLSGAHMLYALDTRARQQALFKIQVTGQYALQGPPHMLLSSNGLNLGSGDDATNGSKLLAISNAGGGQLTWQASTGRPWLQITPKSGSIASGGHISTMVVVDRSGLAPGDYHTSILFTSNTGQITLGVTMKVTPLQPGHEAVMQISPAALTFTAVAGGPDPQPQMIVMNNPGIQILNWGTDVSLQSGSGWLWVSPMSGSVQPGMKQQITVGASSHNLAPGIYKGAILFAHQGSQPVQGSPQSIYVSLTITPSCTLTFAPGSLSFTSEHGQASPPAQALRVNTAQGCATSQTWKASVSTSAGGNWLSIDQSSASTPSTAHISVNTVGLAPGVYNGTLTFTVDTGPQIVPVSVTITPLPCTISAPATLALQGTAGQAGSTSKNVTVSASGDCSHTLNWSSNVSVNTPGGGNWLSATSSGTLTQPSAASVNVQASLAGLSAGTYTGSVTITALDSVTGKTVGTTQVSITLTVSPQCTLQIPSPTSLSFTASAGSDPASPGASFTVGVTGNCSGNVTITPSFDAGNTGWATITGPASIASGGTATFTVTISSSTLAANTYSSIITLTAADGNGVIVGSPQTMTVSLTVS
jgi:hypothetical protein